MSQRLSVDLHIKELVLLDFAPEHQGRIGAALERELARLLAELPSDAALWEGGVAASIDGGVFAMDRTASPESIGASVARAVYGGLARGAIASPASAASIAEPAAPSPSPQPPAR